MDHRKGEEGGSFVKTPASPSPHHLAAIITLTITSSNYYYDNPGTFWTTHIHQEGDFDFLIW